MAAQFMLKSIQVYEITIYSCLSVVSILSQIYPIFIA